MFVREGAIVPATVASSVTNLGTPARADALTVLAWPTATASTFELVDEDLAATALGASTTTLTMSRALRPTYFRVRRDVAPSEVSAGAVVADAAALDAAASGWYHDAVNHWLWIKVPASSAAVSITVAP